MIPILNKLSKQFLSQKTHIFKRSLYEEIDFNGKIIGIIGGRGSGKTTLLHQYAKSSKIKPSKILYISCDHPAMVNQKLYEIADEFYSFGGKLLILDEIHKIKDFASNLKAMYDFTDLQVLFSGSSAMQIEHESIDLSRRALIYNMPPLSFREFLNLSNIENFDKVSLNDILSNHEDITVDITSRIKPLEHFSDYLTYGAYPFFKEGIRSYDNRLLEIVNTTIDSDLSMIFNINSDKLEILKKVLYMLCTTSPLEINKLKLSSATRISWATLSKYLDYMQKGSLVHIVRGSKGFNSLKKQNKLLLNNPNLFQILCANPDIGSLRESFFVSQLKQHHQVHYYDKGDFLVDEKVVIEIGGKSKDKKQIKNETNAYLAIDDIEFGMGNKIPLWLFGFLY
jgi:predicted AAA+ superfamily ATPase